MYAPTFNVFVTGFGPFPSGDGGQFSKNASHEVTKLLPSKLSARSSSNPGNADINIINPTSGEGAYVKTEYKFIREYCEKLHMENDDAIDLFLHVGMAYGWDFVSVERCAYKEVMTSSWAKNWKTRTGYYTTPDDSGKTVKDLGPCPWDDLPIGLSPCLDIDATIDGARLALQTKHAFGKQKETVPIVIKQHEEAGTYCCGFIYYESMAQRIKKGKKPNVLFCHVPGETDQLTLERARDAIVAVIASAANQLMQNGW
ncbi:hypothetical protein B9Z65_8911 [Elsinoe australis]|uniref:Peptidase C15, pyroglutamyl peptidase I-like protein n=1 Tax=Elsinoe australis TaxID=40998 RepID=A0A2P7YF54_9PEZI|nr:hypothetical protein B9Z65_8911 [Elsinoe australis]